MTEEEILKAVFDLHIDPYRAQAIRSAIEGSNLTTNTIGGILLLSIDTTLQLEGELLTLVKED